VKLRQALSGSLTAVKSKFGEWDRNQDGKVDRTEFHQAVAALGLDTTETAINDAFDGFDQDEDGEINYKEYILHMLRELLSLSLSRVMDLFRQWDEDDEGVIDVDKFCKGMAEMGLDAPREDLEAIFGELDRAGTGRVDHADMRYLLRQKVD